MSVNKLPALGQALLALVSDPWDTFGVSVGGATDASGDTLPRAANQDDYNNARLCGSYTPAQLADFEAQRLAAYEYAHNVYFDATIPQPGELEYTLTCDGCSEPFASAIGLAGHPEDGPCCPLCRLERTGYVKPEPYRAHSWLISDRRQWRCLLVNSAVRKHTTDIYWKPASERYDVRPRTSYQHLRVFRVADPQQPLDSPITQLRLATVITERRERIEIEFDLETGTTSVVRYGNTVLTARDNEDTPPYRIEEAHVPEAVNQVIAMMPLALASKVVARLAPKA